MNYFYSMLEEHIGDFSDKELDELVKDLADLFHTRERYLSSDIGEGQWNEERDAFKEKWFTQHGRQKRIEDYLDSIRDEVFMQFGMFDKYCENCQHWVRKGNSDYGDCQKYCTCLWHRKETCKNFEYK